jgi:hypothetical protein
VGSEVGLEDGDQRLAELGQGGLGALPKLLLGDDDAERPPILHPAEAVDAGSVVADALRRLLGRLDLGDQVALGRVPPRELDAGCLADQAASPVAPDEILRPQRLAVGQQDVDPVVVLREAGHLVAVVDARRQLGDPGGHDPLDLILEDPEEIRMTRREVADVQRGRAERHRLVDLAFREEPIGDPTLIQHLDRAREKAARPGAHELMIGTPLDDRDVDLRQRQLGRQRHPRRTSSDDHHRMLIHTQIHHSLSVGSRLRPAFIQTSRALLQALCAV